MTTTDNSPELNYKPFYAIAKEAIFIESYLVDNVYGIIKSGRVYYFNNDVVVIDYDTYYMTKNLQHCFKVIHKGELVISVKQFNKTQSIYLQKLII